MKVVDQSTAPARDEARSAAATSSAPITVAVGPDGSQEAVARGVDEARHTGRRLELVHVCADTDRAQGDSLLRAAGARAHGFEPPALVLHTRPGSTVASELVQAAGRAHVLLLGRRSPGTVQSGASVSEAVASRCDTTVESVPHGWSGGRDHGVVVTGFDATDESRSSLAEAVRLARLHHHTLLVLGAVWGPEHVPGAVARQVEQFRHDATQALQEVGGDAVEVEVAVRPGRPADVLVAASVGADLVVLGRHRPTVSTGSRLGPTAREVLHRVACPVRLVAPVARASTWGRTPATAPVETARS